MSEQITITVNGERVQMPAGSSVAAAVASVNVPCRFSVSGQPRSVLCGMGICFECRVTINGLPHRRSCQIVCEDGMEVTTNA